MEPHIAEKNSVLPLPKQSTSGWSALDRRSYATFVLTVILAYVSALTYLERPLPLAEKIYLIAGSIVFVGVGIFGFAFCKRRNSFLLSLGYLVFQMLLARSIIFVAAAGFIFLIMLPLASQGVILLPRRWMLTFCALLLLVMAVPTGMRFGLEVGIRSGIFNLVGIAFVVYFTLMAVGEHRARAEVERLASELTIANTRLREYATRVETLATNAERNRVAREIHDSLGHCLTGINIQLEAARAVFETERERALDGMRKAQMLTNEGLAEVRRSVAALREPPEATLPLPDALRSVVKESVVAGIQTDFAIKGDARPLSVQSEHTIYRAAQEGLTNVRKHAQAQRAIVILDFSDSKVVRLVIADDGRGGEVNGNGFGLLGLRERTQLLNGDLRIETEPGKGFRLELELPG